MSLPATDSFTLPDGGLGANWTTVTAETNPQIISNAVLPGLVNGPDSVARWNADVFGNDQYAQVSVITANTATTRAVGACIRASNAATTFYHCIARGPLGASATFATRKIVGGTLTTLSTGTFTINANDVVKVSASGTSIVGYINGVSQLTNTDSAIASGSAGVYLFTDAGTGSDAVLDNWEGGNFSSSAAIGSTDSTALTDTAPSNVSLGGQYALERPTADLSSGLWTPSSGGSLFGMLNETIADASTFDRSSSAPAGDTFEVSLGNAPVAIDLNGMPGVLNYQYQGSVTGGRRIDLTVVLLCNSVPVQTWTLPAIQSTFLIAPLQLSSAGLAAIIPGGALSLRTTATQI